MKRPLTPQQVAYFESFGFLKLPGLFAAESDQISRGFDEAFAAGEKRWLPPENEIHNSNVAEYEDKVREMVWGFIEQSTDLAWLRTDPRILGIVHSLIGDHWDYHDSDGNLFNCDVSYHCDVYGAGLDKHSIKIFFYLDHLTAETGALRMIPGTNHYEGDFATQLRAKMFDPERIVSNFGIRPDEVPSYAVDITPGDVLVGDFRTLHASFGGAIGRRLFTMNFTQTAVPAEVG